MGAISSGSLTEASGLVCSRSNPGMLWVINDSGNSPCLYLIDGKGNLIHTYLIEGATNFDWEDIAIATDPTTKQNSIYIADIGDNFAIRDHIKIYVVREPDYKVNQDTIIKVDGTFLFKYEDGPRDAEALIADPVNAELFIISKREENVRIYQAPKPLSDADTMNLTFVGNLPFHNITAGDISECGKDVLLKNYNAVFFWTRNEGESIAQTLAKPHEILQYTPEPQGESIAWTTDGMGYYTLSEKNHPIPQELYFYQRK